MRLIAGVDAVGEGPLAGPIVAAAVILPENFDIPVRDSKKVSEKKREKFTPLIEECAVAYAYGWVDAAKVDEIGKYRAALLSMELAVEHLSSTPDEVLIDGSFELPNIPSRAIIGGDDLIKEISAASIIAKVARDSYMRFLHEKSPQYNWGRNKGYGTAEHMAAIAQHGLHPQHRRSFAPCKNFAKCA
jgi:ribonuclease HII